MQSLLIPLMSSDAFGTFGWGPYCWSFPYYFGYADFANVPLLICGRAFQVVSSQPMDWFIAWGQENWWPCRLTTWSPSHRTYPPPEPCAEALIYPPKNRRQFPMPKSRSRRIYSSDHPACPPTSSSDSSKIPCESFHLSDPKPDSSPWLRARSGPTFPQFDWTSICSRISRTHNNWKAASDPTSVKSLMFSSLSI